MKSTLLLTVLFAWFAANTVLAAESQVIVVVNGTPITEEAYQYYAKSRLGISPGSPVPVEKRQEIIAEIINRELIYQDAVKQGLDKDPIVRVQIENQMKNVMTRYSVDKLLSDTPVGREQMQSVYEEQVGKKASKEYKARHILVETEEEANAAVEELMKGADFIQTAKKHSSGPSSADGGDLGWFNLSQMVKPFADAVLKLKKGAYNQRPVKTEFGWHIILLEDVRNVEPPSFESVEKQLKMVVQNEIINDYIEGLKEKASVEIK